MIVTETLLIESYVTHYNIVSDTEEKGYTYATVVYGSDYLVFATGAVTEIKL